MDRETRKANLKKLQLPGTGSRAGGAIRTRSSKESSTENTNISRYFSTQLPAKPINENATIEQKETINKNALTNKIETNVIENIENDVEKDLLDSSMKNENIPQEIEKQHRTKRTKLGTFLYKDNKAIPLKKSPKNDDFETIQKKAKTAPKVKTKTNAAAKGAKARSKRQPNIKSAFLRNEQLFSEITAQHCLADNCNPDEMQLALAMSRSEAETSGVITIEDDKDVVVDIATNNNNVDESIRTKLKRYGFRTAPKEEFSSITAAFFAGTNRRQKSKWANKFTALTVRNPEQQLKKVNVRINEFLSRQCYTKALSETDSHMEPYQLNSSTLKRVKPVKHMELLKNAENLNTAELNNFYVEKLIEISHIKSGHLLKDWTSIQGRDLSPSRWSTQKKNNDAKLLKAYMELEKYFCQRNNLAEKEKDLANPCTETKNQFEIDHSSKIVVKPVNNTEVMPKTCDNSECELDAMLELIRTTTSQTNNEIIRIELNSENNSPNKEPPEKKLKPDVATEKDVTKNSRDNLNEQGLYMQTQNHWTKNKDTVPSNALKGITQFNRATSPDIFASSDVETDEENIIFAEVGEKFELKNNLTKTCNGITIFEKYSSDEVKNSHCAENEHFKGVNVTKDSNCNMFVDLTQEDSNSTVDSELPIQTEILGSKISPVKEHAETEILLRNQIFNVKETTLEITEKDRSFAFEDLTQKINSLNSTPNSKGEDSSFEATNDTIFEALRRKYLGSGRSTAKCNRKSVSMTQINEPGVSLNKSKRHLSFTQMNQKIIASVENITPTTKDAIFVTPIKNSKISSTRLTQSPSPFHLEVSSQHTRTKSSIDLTQNEDSTEEFIMLSDDEINYSIWKADKTTNPSPNDKSVINTNELSSDSDMICAYPQENTIKRNLFDEVKSNSETAAHNFSYLDLLDADKSFNAKETAGNVSCTQACLNLDIDAEQEPIQSQYLAIQTDLDLCSPNPQKQSQCLTTQTDLDLCSPTPENQLHCLTTQTDLDLCSPTPETPNMVDLSKERAEFGILECYSEPFMKSTCDSASKQIEAANLSYLNSPSEITAPMKRYRSSTSSQKFNELIKSVENTQTNDNPNYLDDYDEFDRLVFGTPKLKSPQKPMGFEQLLTGEISFREERQKKCYTTPKKLYVSPSKNAIPNFPSPIKTTQELQIDGKSYVIRVTTTPKPDFTKQTDAELLKQLYNFGIKPLKRGQAEKMLEYIYNQTHPILINENQSYEESQLIPTMSQKVESIVVNSGQSCSQLNVEENINEQLKTLSTNKFKFSDCCGNLLLRHRYHLNAELVEDHEEYVFQTNVSKKISQALLPLHVAWFNLVCSNVQLHEAILMYEPIDLQEVYIFFKTLGFRYDPKDLKTFFDRRCIIFRYDLTQPGTNRHVRKKKKKL